MSLPPDPELTSFVCRACATSLTIATYSWAQMPTCKKCGNLMSVSREPAPEDLKSVASQRRVERLLVELGWELEVGAWRGCGVRATTPEDSPEVTK